MDSTYKRMLGRAVEFLEYLLLLLVIAECNSMFTSAQLVEVKTGMSVLFYRSALVVLGTLLVLHVLLDVKVLKRLLPYIPFCLLLTAYAAAFYGLNVAQVSRATREKYLLRFMALLPMLVLLFKIKQQKGEGLDLLYKYSDIVRVIAAMSLLVYLTSVFHLDDLTADPIYTRWGGHGSIYKRINLLNVCQFIQGNNGQWQIPGITLLRNNGFFVETLMFSVPLITALSTELFLRRPSDVGHSGRAILLSLALLSASSTIGLMLMSAVWACKGLSIALQRKKYHFILILLIAMLALCAFFVAAKQGTVYEAAEIPGSSGTSISDHVEDYRASLKAFLHKPLLGGGFGKEAYIREFMNPEKVSRNPGLSNSAGVVLGEGGLMLGMLCGMPFLLCLLYLFKREKWGRRVALWVIGPLGAFVGIIFIYHIFLFVLMAFGYSLIEVEWVRGKGFPVRLRLADLSRSLDEPELSKAQAARCRRRALTVGLGAAGAGILLICFGVPVFQAIHSFMRIHQLYMGQSPLKALCFGVVLLVHGICLRAALRREMGWPRLAGLLVWDALYLLVYPRLYADFHTLMIARGFSDGLLECAALLGIYGAGVVAVMAAPASKRQLDAARLAVSAAAVIGGAALFFTAQPALAGLASPDISLVSAAGMVTDAAAGRVFVCESPALFRGVNDRLSLPRGGISGFDVCEDVSLICANGEDRWELFSRGFQVARLTEGYLLYTNDQSVIDALSGQDAEFYRYYAYDVPVDLKALARSNKRKTTSDGGIRVGKGMGSLEKGPSIALQKGKYAAVYKLKITRKNFEDLDGDTPVCTLAVSCISRKGYVAMQEVTLSRFDEKGRATVMLPFEFGGFVDGVNIVLLGSPDHTVKLQSLVIRQTPTFITETVENCHLMPIRETYFNLDGTPCVQPGGYCALERDYNLKCLVKAVRYYDADMRPTLCADGYAEVRNTYNSRGSKICEAYFGIDDRPVVNRHRYSSIVTEYDGQGNARRIRYLGTQGELMVCDGGYAELRRAFNNHHLVIREEYYGADGGYIMQTSGYCRLEQDFDDADNLIARRFFGPEGPVLRTDGYAEVRWQYDGAHRVVREDFLGAEGEPVTVFEGYSSDERAYDAYGNVATYRYYDAAGQLTLIQNGYAEVRRVYNDRRQLTREAYYGPDGQSILLSNGYAAQERDYDAQGRVRSQRYYGAKGEPVLTKDGYFEICRAYDEAGNQIEERYYDAWGNPVDCAAGYACARRAYDARGLLAEETFFDTQGAPAAIDPGYTRITYEYTEDLQLALTRYLDANGNSVQAGSGYFHDYLRSLMGEDVTVFISVKDEAVSSLTATLYDDFRDLGLRTDLRGRFRNSYCAVVSPEGVAEEITPQGMVSHEGTVNGVPYTVVSAGFQVGNTSSVIIDGVEYSKNGRGFNIVVYDNSRGQVTDSVVFDTYEQAMTVRR